MERLTSLSAAEAASFVREAVVAWPGAAAVAGVLLLALASLFLYANSRIHSMASRIVLLSLFLAAGASGLYVLYALGCSLGMCDAVPQGWRP